MAQTFQVTFRTEYEEFFLRNKKRAYLKKSPCYGVRKGHCDRGYRYHKTKVCVVPYGLLCE